MLEAIIFDFDGTVANTIPGITVGVNLTLQKYGLPTHTEEEMTTYINNGPRMLIRRSLPRELQEDEELLERVLKDYNGIYQSVCKDGSTAYDGILPLLSRLRERGLRIGILSNKQDHLLGDLCKNLFGDRIDCTVGTLPDRPAKPDPYLSNKTVELLGVRAENCLLIGDSDVDILTAKNVGMHHIGVSWGYRSREFLLQNGATEIADTPDILYSLIEKML